jgi:arylsulfatase A-like enzyme
MRAWFAAVLLALLGCGVAPDARPNLVLVIGDDHGWRDFGFAGSPYARTPRLDRLAAEGTVFPLGYTTASVCRPSLLSLLTGLDPSQFARRVQRLEREARRPLAAGDVIRGVVTLPRALAAVDYASFQAGKFFEGGYADAGFSAGMMTSPRDDDEVLARRTLQPVFDFLERRRDGPFFLWFAPKLPHVPHDPPQRFRDVYADVALPAGTLLYYANVTRFDAAVGELLDRLDALGLRERTLVVYLADNGWLGGPVEGPYLWSLGRPRGKDSLYDGGFRTPLVLCWPGHVPAGAVREELVSSLDVFPTLLDYAGAPPVSGLLGRSLRPLLEGRAAEWRDALVGYQQTVRADTPEGVRIGDGRPVPGGHFVRTRRWHLLDWDQRKAELYDVAADPDEQHDLAARHPEVVEQLRRRIRKWQSEIDGSSR